MTHQKIQKNRGNRTLEKKENSMTCMAIIVILVVGGILGNPSSLAIPSLLPDYPDYQTGASVVPEFGSPGANDLGQSTLDVSPVPREASAYQDVDAVNAMAEVPSCLESRGERVLRKVMVHPDSIFSQSMGRFISILSRRGGCEISLPMERKRWRL